MAFLSQTNAVEQAAVRVERRDGTQLPFHGHDDTSRGAALLAAAAAAATGDTIRLGPGAFALGTAALDLPHGASLCGAGPGVSTVTSTATGRAIVVPGTNSVLADLSVVGVAGAGSAAQHPIGSMTSAGDKAFVGAAFYRVRTSANTHGVLVRHASACSFKAYQCEFECGADAVYLENATAELHDCTLRADAGLANGSPAAGADTRGVAGHTAGAADVTLYGGRITCAAGSATNRCLAAAAAGTTLRAFGVSVSSSGAGAAEFHQTAGAIAAAGCFRPDGAAPVASGAVTYADAPQLLASLKTADGAASGLDADLLRGLAPATANTASTLVQRDGAGGFSAGAVGVASLSAGGTVNVGLFANNSWFTINGQRALAGDALTTVLYPTGSGGDVRFNNFANNAARLVVRDDGNIGVGTITGVTSRLTFAAATNAAGGILFGADTNLYRSATDTLTTDDTLVAGGGLVVGTGALATNATGGFFYADSCAGTPTGTPVSFAGRVPVVVDTTNSKLYAFVGGVWKSVTLT
jgi:hypothetical protein